MCIVINMYKYDLISHAISRKYLTSRRSSAPRFPFLCPLTPIKIKFWKQGWERVDFFNRRGVKRDAEGLGRQNISSSVSSSPCPFCTLFFRRRKIRSLHQSYWSRIGYCILLFFYFLFFRLCFFITSPPATLINPGPDRNGKVFKEYK